VNRAGAPVHSVTVSPTADELREYADEHLLYEVWMVAALAERMKRHAALFDAGLSKRHGPLANELLDLAGRNADIESFATHMRNLVQFLYPHKPKGGTVIAADYFTKRSDWETVRPKRPESLMVANQRVPIEIGHLVLGRARREDKTWNHNAIWLDLAKVLRVFVDNVPAQRVSSEFKDALRTLVSTVQPQEMLVQYIDVLEQVAADATEAGRIAGLGATTAPDFAVSDTDESTAGTATKLPPREPPTLDYDPSG
jgi:hypothetical protein